MTPRHGNTILFRFSQQLPRLGLGTFWSWNLLVLEVLLEMTPHMEPVNGPQNNQNNYREGTLSGVELKVQKSNVNIMNDQRT